MKVLVTGAAGIHAHGDVPALFIDCGDDRAGFVVESVFGAGIADLLDSIANDARDIHVTRGSDFSGDEDQAGRRRTFTSYTAIRVLGKDGVQNSVRHLITNLIRMPTKYRFACYYLH